MSSGGDGARPKVSGGGRPGGASGWSKAAAGGGAAKRAQMSESSAVKEARDARRAHLTSRAAILALVVCAIALTLAYPVREYIAQRDEIAQLGEQQKAAQQQVEQLSAEQQRLGNESYIKGEARRRLHMCDPTKNCYVVLDDGGNGGQDTAHAHPAAAPPWYVTLWRSVDASGRQR